MGFIWIATNDGLCRYDGPNLVKVYRQTQDASEDSNTLESNNIRSLFCDKSGVLWIGTRFGGLTKFNPLTNEWKTFRHDKEKANSINNDEVLSIFEDSKERLWIGTEQGLNLLNRSSSNFTHFKLYDEENLETGERSVLTIMEDARGWIWVGTWAHGLHLLLEDQEGNLQTESTRHFHITEDKASNNVWSLFNDKDDNFWIGSHGGGLILMHNPEESSNQSHQQKWQPIFHKYTANSIHSSNLQSNTIQSIIQDQFNNLWFGCAYGLYRLPEKSIHKFNPEKKISLEFQRFKKKNNDVNSIVSNSVTHLFEDEQGLIWISTIDGVSQFNWYSNHFRNHDFTDPNLTTPSTASLTLDQEKNIWVTFGFDGIRKFKIIDEELIPLDNDIGNLINGKELNSIYSPHGKRLYIGTENGVSIVDLESKRSTDYLIPSHLRSSIQNLKIESFLEDKSDNIWFGSKLGLFKIDSKTKEFFHFEPELNNVNSISDLAVNHIIEDSKGQIWVATYKGLNRIKKPNDKNPVFEKFLHTTDIPEQGPSNNQIMHLEEYNDYLYIGTSSGLCRYNFIDGKFQTYEDNKYWIRSIELGSDNNLWVSSSEGIFQFNPENETFRYFDSNDGLVTQAYEFNSSFKDNDDRLYFVYGDGFTSFLPKTIPRNTIAPPVYITEIEKMSREGVKVEEGIYNNRIDLDHDDYRISIRYAALNYNRADKNQYQFKLEGFEDDWNKAKFGSPIVYTSLEPGNYTLKIKAANNDGIWNEEGTSLKIIQHAPYWKTLWFRLIALFTCIGLVLLFLFWYTNNIRNYNEDLKSYNANLNKEIKNRKRAENQLQDYNKELKRSNKDLEQFAYVSSHDLKEPLRTIGNFSSLLENNYSEELDENALEYLGFIKQGVKRMSNVIDSLLTYSTVGKKDSVYESVDLNILLANKAKDLTQLIKDKNAKIEIGKLPTINAHKEQLGMVFFNLINNALKFNTSPVPSIIIKEEKASDAYWKFSVSDNGIGIEPKYQDVIFDIFKRLHNKQDYEGTGIGLSLCQKIILRHQGKIWFKSEPNEGTTFFFTIKKDLSDLNEH